MTYFVRISHIIRISIGYICSRDIRSICDLYNLLLFKEILFYLFKQHFKKIGINIQLNTDRDISIGDILILKNVMELLPLTSGPLKYLSEVC